MRFKTVRTIWKDQSVKNAKNGNPCLVRGEELTLMQRRRRWEKNIASICVILNSVKYHVPHRIPLEVFSITGVLRLLIPNLWVVGVENRPWFVDNSTTTLVPFEHVTRRASDERNSRPRKRNREGGCDSPDTVTTGIRISTCLNDSDNDWHWLS